MAENTITVGDDGLELGNPLDGGPDLLSWPAGPTAIAVWTKAVPDHERRHVAFVLENLDGATTDRTWSARSNGSAVRAPLSTSHALEVRIRG